MESEDTFPVGWVSFWSRVPPTLGSAVGSRQYRRKPQRALTVLLLEACDQKRGVFQVSTDMWLQRTEGSAQHLPALIQRVIRFALKFSPLKRGAAERWKGLLTEEVSVHKMKGNRRGIYLDGVIEGSESCLPLSFCGGTARRKYCRWNLDDSSSTSCPGLLSLDDGLDSVVSHDRLRLRL